MKLLLDQNLSWKLVKRLSDHFPGTEHLRSVLPTDADDTVIWDFARDNGFAIVSKDDDFERRSILLGYPPKIIWIRLGNCKSEDILSLLVNSRQIVRSFIDDTEKSMITLP